VSLPLREEGLTGVGAIGTTTRVPGHLSTDAGSGHVPLTNRVGRTSHHTMDLPAPKMMPSTITRVSRKGLPFLLVRVGMRSFSDRGAWHSNLNREPGRSIRAATLRIRCS
jgi:hypothetical protein